MKLFLIKKWITDNSATASIEFAMISFGFLLLLFGVVEVGRLAWTSNVIDYAIDESARYAVLHQNASSSEVEMEAKDMLQSFFISPNNLNIMVSTASSAGVSFIEIQGNYRFESMISGFFPSSFSQINLDVVSRRPVYIYD